MSLNLEIDFKLFNGISSNLMFSKTFSCLLMASILSSNSLFFLINLFIITRGNFKKY